MDALDARRWGSMRARVRGRRDRGFALLCSRAVEATDWTPTVGVGMRARCFVSAQFRRKRDRIAAWRDLCDSSATRRKTRRHVSSFLEGGPATRRHARCNSIGHAVEEAHAGARGRPACGRDQRPRLSAAARRGADLLKRERPRSVHTTRSAHTTCFSQLDGPSAKRPSQLNGPLS